MNKKVTLRPATMDDANMLLEWRNDPETRDASHSMAIIQKGDHLSWLARTLNDPDRRLYIAEANGDPVGTVRADYKDDAWELSWTVSPHARGRGLAKQMVAVVANQIPGTIRAEVKKGNIASVRIAEYVGMEFEREEDGVCYYKRASHHV